MALLPVGQVLPMLSVRLCFSMVRNSFAQNPIWLLCPLFLMWTCLSVLLYVLPVVKSVLLKLRLVVLVRTPRWVPLIEAHDRLTPMLML